MPVYLSASSDKVKAKSDNLQSYRLRLNHLDMSNRDILPYLSLYRDNVDSCFAGFSEINNLDFTDDYSQPNPDEYLIIATPIPESNQMQTFDVIMNQGATDSQNKILFVYKRVTKQV